MKNSTLFSILLIVLTTGFFLWIDIALLLIVLISSVFGMLIGYLIVELLEAIMSWIDSFPQIIKKK